MSKELYLGEIIKRDGVMIQKGKNNLIVAPAGSGKTHYIFNELLDKTKRNIYLCDTSNLMESIARDEDYFDNTIALKEDLNAGKEGFELDKYNCTVMTYAKFFYEMNKLEYKDVDMIICDEIHNLFKYMDRFKENNNYKNVIEHLEDRALNGTKLISFTATHDRIKRVIAKEEQCVLDEKYKLWNVIDYSDNKDIKKLKYNNFSAFNDISQIKYWFSRTNLFKYGKKCLIYTDRITTAKEQVEYINSYFKDINAIAIWSLNNENHKMNEEQLKARKSIIETGLIPEEYNVLIINASYETGINIKDENIEIVIVNNSDYDTRIQARSRVRKDIDLFLYRVPRAERVEFPKITVPTEYLDRKLDAKEKKELIKLLDIRDMKGRLMGWTNFKKILLFNQYELIDGRIKNKRVSTIKDLLEIRE